MRRPWDCNLGSVKKAFGGVKMESASLRWSSGNVNDKIESLEPDVGSTLKSMADWAPKKMSQVTQSVKNPFSEH